MDKASETKQPLQVDVAPATDAMEKGWQAQKNFIKNHWWAKFFLLIFVLFFIFVLYFVGSIFFSVFSGTLPFNTGYQP